jgi:hypothetical protein
VASVTGGDEAGRKTMFLPSMIKLMENGVNMMSKPGTSAAKIDDNYYPTKALTPAERQLAMALLAEQSLPEGSIFVLYPDKAEKLEAEKVEEAEQATKRDEAKREHAFGLVPDPYAEEAVEKLGFGKPSGRETGAKFVQKFLNSSEHPEWAEIETVVIPGCGSSPLGAAALGKTVANMYGKEVAAIVAGQGAFDLWLEATPGGMVMAPMANALNFYDRLFEFIAKVTPMADIGAKLYVNDLLDAMHEASTLCMLLKARLVDGSFNNLNMIVSHSKGNWAVLVALLAFELELIDGAQKPEKPIKVVTFGNPVDLPDMNDRMKEFFQYFQFAGEVDPLAHNCSARAWKLHFNGIEKLDPQKPVFHVTKAEDEKGLVERMVANTGHHLVAHTDPEFCPFHMPIEKILPHIH